LKKISLPLFIGLGAALLITLALPAFAEEPAAASYHLEGGPRNPAPAGAYTKFFKQQAFTVTGKASNFINGQEGEIDYALPYFWFQPDGAPYPPGLKFPLVILLHGTSGNVYAAQSLLQSKMQLDYPAFIAIPVQPEKWIWDSPREYAGYPQMNLPLRMMRGLYGVAQMAKSLAATQPVDPSRIYIVGCSEGGIGAFAAALKYPDVFAAAVPISGAWNISEAPKINQIPLWAFHGTLDPIVPAALTRTLAAAIKKSGGNITYTEFPNISHDCSSPMFYTQAMWKWLFSQHK